MLKNVCTLKSLLVQIGSLALISAATFNLPMNAAATELGLDVLAGTWRGDGTMLFESGQTENISCNGYYKSTGGLSIVIRCKGVSSNFELRSKLSSNGDRILGSWEERTYNAAGAVTGAASAGKLDVQFSGSLIGNLEMNYSPSSQSVSVSVGTKGAGIKGVRVNFNRM